MLRLAAVSVVSALYSQLGEQFLPLLPESMQFISELLEDDDTEVEKLTSQLLANLDKLLGEENTIRSLLQ